MTAAMETIAVLLLEDSPLDAELTRAALRRAGLDTAVTHVSTRAAFTEALADGRAAAWDVILADYALPDFDGIQALEQARALRPDVPFIFVSGTLGEDIAVEMLHRGATDYVVKQRLDRLVPSVLRAVTEARTRREHERAVVELHAAETRARVALAAGKMATWEYDPSTDLFVWSDGATEQLGLPTAALGGALASFLDVVETEDRVRVREALTRAARGEDNVAVEFGIRSADGAARRVHGIGRSYGGGGTVVGVAMDVTERRRAEEHLRRVQRLEAVGQLAGGVAHETNNQMAVVMGFADFLLKRDDLPADVRADVEQIMRAAERTAGITRQLLTFSRRHVNRPEIVPLSDQIETFEPVLRRTLGERGSLCLELRSPARVRIDRGQLEQVLLNLTLNAADAIAPGGQVTISTANIAIAPGTVYHGVQLRPGPYVLLAVADTGHGMTRETLDRVFEPFFTTKEVGRGSGLGLAAVYGIVKQADGYVWIQSAPGAGTRVEISLPRSADPEPAPAPDAIAAGGAESILVVDDEPSVRTVLVRALQGHGYRTLEAGDGVDALAQLREASGAVDLVVTDVAMPRMDGPELVAALRRTRPSLPVLFIAGYAESLAGGELESAGTAFLAKPFAPNAVLEQVRALLDARGAAT